MLFKIFFYFYKNMNILSSVIHIFNIFSTYIHEKNINYSDLMEKGMYFLSNNYKDYHEIKNIESVYINI